MRRLLICTVLLTMHIMVRGQATYGIRYWFDRDTTVYTTQVTDGRWTEAIDVSHLSEWLHTLHIQVSDDTGLYGVPETRFFMKSVLPDSLLDMKIHYWFDRDLASVVTADYTAGLLSIDVDGLTDGLHTLHIMPNNGRLGATHTQYFIKTHRPYEYLELLCYVDGDLHEEKRVDGVEGIVSWPIDLNGYKHGLHHMQLMSVSPQGEVTSTYSTLFMRTRTNEEWVAMKCYYIIDDSLVNTVGGSCEDNHYLFELDVTSLTEGEHNIVCILMDELGAVAELQTATFIKTPHETGMDILFNEKDAVEIYDLSGRRVDTITKSGVYIINGRKILLTI